MYAVIRTGGKQYRVNPGDVLRVEKLPGAVGDQISLEDVLMVGGDGDPVLGKPVVSDAKVNARIVEQDRAKKVIVYKHKRRKGYHLKQGHRQHYTALAIESIELGGKVTTAATAKSAKAESVAEPEASDSGAEQED